jgi:hypothetical protein
MVTGGICGDRDLLPRRIWAALKPCQRRICSSTFCELESVRTHPSPTKGVLACGPTC